MRTREIMGTLALAAVVGCGARETANREAEETATVPTTPAVGGQVIPITEDTPGLFAKAAVPPEQARTTALAAVPGGVIEKGELEEEDGKLIYSFDIRIAGQAGITEVHVDAQTGSVVKTEHEAEGAEGTEKAKGL